MRKGGLHPKQPQKHRAGDVEKIDERSERFVEQFERTRHEQGYACRFSKETVFGVISPKTITRNVTSAKATTTAMACAEI